MDISNYDILHISEALNAGVSHRVICSTFKLTSQSLGRIGYELEKLRILGPAWVDDPEIREILPSLTTSAT